MPDQIKVLFAVLSTYEREGWIHPSILQFFCDLPFQSGYAHRMVPVHNFKPAAAGRNVFCRQAKDTDTDWICMIDNDMQIPANLLDAVANAPADADIVCPTFYMWTQNDLKLTLCWGTDKAHEGYGSFTPGYHELTKCGTGVIFIRPRVLRAMEFPYFRYIYNADCGLEGTEDIQFCLSAREKGFKIYGTTEVKVGHYHSVEIGSLWEWAEKTQKSIDKARSEHLVSAHQDSGRSPDRTAEMCSIEAT